MKTLLTALVSAGLLTASLAVAAGPVKIGMVTTLSTKAGYLGEEIRDGFKLAVDQEKGTLGGIPVELIVEDDEAKPEKGKQLAERLVKKDGVRIMTGIVFSNVAMAVVPKVVREDGRRPVRHRGRASERLPAGAELPRRQGPSRRLQTVLQG